MNISLKNPSFSAIQLINPNSRPVFITKVWCPLVRSCSSFTTVIKCRERGNRIGVHFFNGLLRGRVNSTSSYRGHWEDPDSGIYSEDDSDDENEEMEENDLDFESDWEEEEGSPEDTANTVEQLSTSNSEEDYLVKEVEQLLSPEERAILEQNEARNLEKISTAKWNPLHTFGLAGQIKFMDDLLENGYDIDLADKDGLTALHHAIIGKKEPVVSHLLRKGANPQARDLDGAAPLHYAVHVGALQTVKLLMKYNVDVNVADNEGWTPLHVAMQTRNRDITKVLLVNGADKTRRNNKGNTAFDLGICYGKDFKSYDLSKLLKQVGASTDL